MPVLRMTGIRKAFPGVVALDGVDLEVRAGEVHVLLGENGAGKSTLMKVLSGAQRADAGRIELDGREADIRDPRTARELGIAIIYQELALVPSLSAAENVLLGREPRLAWGILDRRMLRARAGEVLRTVGARFDPATPVERLSIAERQLVEIARALSLDARVLVMDEPTSALSERETRALFAVVRDLTARGAAVVFISHRLDEIFEIGDRVTILRDGRSAGTLPVAGADRRELVRMMVGREVGEVIARTPAARGGELLRVERVTRRGVLDDVSLVVHAGEIVALAGLLGSGRTEVARAIFGADPVDSGRVLMRGRDVRARSPMEAIRAGVGFVTEDRKGEGLVLELSVRENITLPLLRRTSRLGVASRRAEVEVAERYRRELGIRTPSIEQRVLHLSGGNQQKVVLAKWLAQRVDVLILDEPTRGIDVGAKEEIHRLVDHLVSGGMGVLLISSELPEVVGLADRVLVMREGRIVAELERGETTQELVLAHAVGA